MYVIKANSFSLSVPQLWTETKSHINEKCNKVITADNTNELILCHTGSFGSNSGVNEKCNVIILGDKVKVAVMQSNDGLNEETLLVNDVLRRN